MEFSEKSQKRIEGNSLTNKSLTSRRSVNKIYADSNSLQAHERSSWNLTNSSNKLFSEFQCFPTHYCHNGRQLRSHRGNQGFNGLSILSV